MLFVKQQMFWGAHSALLHLFTRPFVVACIIIIIIVNPYILCVVLSSLLCWLAAGFI